MLKRENRVVAAGDFRCTVRAGRRIATPHALIYLSVRNTTDPSRVGFIVSKAVGNAVTRNLVTRRLRSIAHDIVAARPTGTDLIIRALPGSPLVSWTTLQSEIFNGIDRSDAR